MCLLLAEGVLGQQPSAAPPSASSIPSAGAPLPGSQPTPTVAPVPPPDALGRSTPYGCVIGFLQAVADKRLSIAVQYLDTRLPEDRAEQLAIQLKAVLDSGLSSSIESLSRHDEGDARDGLRLTRDKVGTAKLRNGDLEIWLDRVQHGQSPSVWLFSSGTLAKIPEAYSQLQTHSFADSLPKPFTSIQLFGLPLWRFLAIIIALGIVVLSASLMTRALVVLFRSLLRKDYFQDQDKVLYRLTPPVRLLLVAIALRIVSSHTLSLLARHYWMGFAAVLMVIGCGWLFIRISDLVAEAGTRRSIETGVQAKIAIISLVQRLFKVLIAFAVLLILLRQSGVNVSGMLEGLGIGGIALALAAQKTLENVFGGISIITRETIRVGDYSRIADQTGTIEDIGLSFTRMRKLDRTVVSIPNGKIAELSSENFTLRDNFCFNHILSLRFDTSQQQIERVLGDVQGVLKRDPKVQAGTNRVNLIGLQGASFQVEIFAYIEVASYNAFLVCQQELLLKLLAAVADAGASLAFPSQTTYLEAREVERTSAPNGQDYKVQ